MPELIDRFVDDDTEITVEADPGFRPLRSVLRQRLDRFEVRDAVAVYPN
jgi:hypothetical protein